MAPVTASVRRPELEHRFVSHSPSETFSLGVHLGRLLQPGDFVGLIGELGAGKTHFVRGVAEGAQVPRSQVASPSFAIVYPYRGRIPIYHADFFRMGNYDEVYATGFTDLAESDGAVLVEWLNRVPEAAPSDLLLLLFDGGGSERCIAAEAFGSRYSELLRQWLSAAS